MGKRTAILGMVAAALLMPAAASAATLTVNPAAAAGCAPASGDRTCKTLEDARLSAVDNDTLVLKASASAYATTTAPFAQNGLTIKSEKPLGAVIFSSTGTALTLSGTGTAVSGVLAASGAAPAIRFTGSGTSKLVGAEAVTAGIDQPAVEVLSATPGAKTLNVSSVIAIPGPAGPGTATDPNASGFRAVSSGKGVPVVDPPAGDITINAKHVTVPTGKNGFELDAGAHLVQPLLLPPAPPDCPGAGNIVVNVSDSIAKHDASKDSVYAGDTTDCKSSAKFTGTNNAPADATDAQLFVDAAKSDFHLRADAVKALGKGTDAPAGDELKDIDGDARTAPTDLGADQFVNKLPVAKLVVAPTTVTLGSPIAGRATDSTDPDAAIGGGITAYEFNWGDGTAPEAASTGIAAHTYTAIGTYQVKVKVTDRNGGVTTSDPVSVTVTAAATTGSTGTTGTTGTTTGDTAPPVVAITAPKPAAKLRRDRTIVISGSVSDQTGVRNVLITVRRTRDAKNKRISGCQFWDGVKTLKPASCTSPILIRGLTVDLTWRRTIVGKTLPAGTYEVRVQATDLNGFTTVLTTNARSPVRTFRLIDPPKKTTKKK